MLRGLGGKSLTGMTNNWSTFQNKILERGKKLYRSFPWRDTKDAYEILISEVMLQQTQVKRVLNYWQSWLQKFPSVQNLAAAPLSYVLEAWQGLGYNRRAINLHICANIICEEHGGCIPTDSKALLALPGIGAATAAGVRVFAFSIPDIYIETNVRTVIIHEFFADENNVSDKKIASVLAKLCPKDETCREFYYALLDIGADLKAQGIKSARRAKAYTKQAKFEGSHRQKRSFLLRCVLDGISDVEELTVCLNDEEQKAKRSALSMSEVKNILLELQKEGFITFTEDMVEIIM